MDRGDTLKSEIKHLMELQAFDIQVGQLDKKMAAGNTEVEKRKVKLDERRGNIEKVKTKLENGEARRRELEAEVEDEVAKLKERQAKLMNVQTNREYQSLLKEIEDAKNTNKKREEEIVKLMELAESCQKELEEEKNVSEAEEKLLAEEAGKTKKQIARFNSEKSKIVKTRDSKAKKVAANYLKKYELLLQKRNGLAIVGVTNGVCSGCHMNIPPQMFNNLLREDELLSCPTCNRMMYYQPESKDN